MYHKVQNTVFLPLKYHAINYSYQKLASQRFAFEWLSIHNPSSLYQDKHYYHDGRLNDDKYRRPWTRASGDSNMMNFSVLDIWKKCVFTEDLLEKKLISYTDFCISDEDVEIIPSSNPYSQSNIEEAYEFKELDKTELSSTCYLKLDYVPISLKDQEEGLYIEEELVFTDNLTSSAKWLPTLQALLSRLNVFQVLDPLLNSKGEHFREEDIFRDCFIFKKNVKPQEEGTELNEDFCKVSLKNEEIPLLLVQFQFYEATNSSQDSEIVTCLALKSFLQITPENLGDGIECLKITDENLSKTNKPEVIEISKNCSTQEVYAFQNTDLPQFSDDRLCYNGELDVPLTPPNRSEKLHMNSLHVHLKPEPVSPINNIDFITESTSEYLEGLMWQSEKYQHTMTSLFLIEPPRFVALCQQFPVRELKTLLGVYENNVVTGPLEEDGWINLRENLTQSCVLETLSINLDSKGRDDNMNIEDFSKITNVQLEEWLEEKGSFHHSSMKIFSFADCTETKDYFWSPKKRELSPSLAQEPASVQYSASKEGDSVPTENHAGETKLQSEIEKPMHVRNHEEEKNNQADCKKVSANCMVRNKKPVQFRPPRKCRDDFDLLNDFIMLRSQRVITQSEETNSVDIQKEVLDAKEESPSSESNKSPVVLGTTVPMENQAKDNHAIAFIEIKTSESQSQAYHILEAAVAPVMKDLMNLGLQNWKFATLNSDDTRFFLKQQEKVISDTFKQGPKDGKYIMLFRHAAILHLLITARDLLLTCSLNTAIEYLSSVKDSYKDLQDSHLDNIWKQLKIVEYVVQEHSVSPKITEVQHQISKWVQNNTNDHKKVVIVTRVDLDEEIEVLINAISTVHGLKTIYMNSKERGIWLESKNVINCLDIYSCIVVRNQDIGPDFPWTNFSLVIDYNYFENSYWIDLCKKLNISYLSFQTTVPESIETAEVLPDNLQYVLLRLPIPYVFLTSEGLLNIPEILQLLESKYNITLIERYCCETLQYFGGTEHYIVMTIDECTAIVIQNMEELNYEKSPDNIVLRQMTLSLQYTSCWIILYSRERLNSIYSLTGKTLHHLSLIYAALIQFAQTSEDFEVKVALTPGAEETALLVRQIADHILLTSEQHAQEWLNKSWLSVLPSEAEKCLLTFPCMNPLVAQVMLKKSSSLEWLLAASFDQLQELLPEVPEKVLKNFSDITSLYIFKPVHESETLEEIINSAICSSCQLPSSEALFSRLQGHIPYTEYSKCFHEEQNKNYVPAIYKNESCTSKSAAKHNLVAPSIAYEGDINSFQENVGEKRQQNISFLKKAETERRMKISHITYNNMRGPTHTNNEITTSCLHCNQDISFYSENCPQNRMTVSKVIAKQELKIPDFLKNPIHNDTKSECLTKKQPLVQQHNSTQDFKHSCSVSNRKDIPFQQSSGNFLEIGGKICSNPELPFKERFGSASPFIKAMDSSPFDSHFCKVVSTQDRYSNQGFQFTGKCTREKGPNSLSAEQQKQRVSAGLKFMRSPQIKKRRLIFEKDPGRLDGQTRLKFF